MLSKPSWLRNVFSAWNWDILTWHIYIGEEAESAVDWVIDWLNWGIELAQNAYDWAQEAISYARDLFNSIWDSLGSWINYFSDQLSALWAQINNWWSAVVSYVSQVYNTLRNEVMTWLADFLTFNWFSSWWGNLSTTFSAWWDSAWQKILEAITLAMVPLIKEVNRLSGIAELVTEFLSNPVGYIWARFLDWFLGE